MGKLVVLGIDGAEWKIIEPLVREGCLPNIKRIMGKGSRAKLKTTIPPLTSPAWRSIFTGANPGRHGVFDFTTFEDGKPRYTSSRDTLVPNVWELMDEKCIAFNIPCTYPLKKTPNTVAVSGFDTPSKESPFAYPPEVKEEILELEPDFTFHPLFPLMSIAKKRTGNTKSLLTSLGRMMKVARHLLEKKEWESAFLVFSETDWVQHFFMHEFMSAERKSDTKIAAVYKLIDQFIGELINKGYNLIIVSDHGFYDIERICFINSCLLDKGLLSLKKQSNLRGMLRTAGLTREAANSFILSRFYAFWKRSGHLKGAIQLLPPAYPEPLEAIDLKTSSAYMLSATSNGVIVKSPGDVDRTAKALEDICDGDGKKLLKKVLRREDIYSGDAVEKAPHLLLVPEEGVMMKAALFPSVSKKPDYEDGEGYHAQFGVFMSYGKDLDAKGELDDVTVMDIAPTVLAHFGYAVPGSMDGKCLPIVKTPKKLRKTSKSQTRLAVKRLFKK